MQKICNEINSKSLTIGIIGLGYVGLPLAISFVKAGHNVLGFEKNQVKINHLKTGKSYVSDVQDDDISVFFGDRLNATVDFSKLINCKAIIICVPTPLDKFKKPNMDYIQQACIDIGRNMGKGTFVCLESTTYPTTTEDFVCPIIEKESGFKAEEDFWLAFSPERVDPGNKVFNTKNTPKVFGAISKEGEDIGRALYESAIDNVHVVSSPRVAEMVKILENTYRLVNISLVNELALLSSRMDINIWEVIEAAKTKPYGFQAFYPGPGIGGHCIPLDPFYLEHIAKQYNFDLTMIHTAGQIDNLMPHRMMVKINFALNKKKKALNGSRLLFIGVAYKANIGDERESPSLKVIEEVKRKGSIVEYHDPYVENITTNDGKVYNCSKLDESTIKSVDCVVIMTKHDIIDFDYIKKQASLIVDLRNVYTDESANVIKL